MGMDFESIAFHKTGPSQRPEAPRSTTITIRHNKITYSLLMAAKLLTDLGEPNASVCPPLMAQKEA